MKKLSILSKLIVPIFCFMSFNVMAVELENVTWELVSHFTTQTNMTVNKPFLTYGKDGCDIDLDNFAENIETFHYVVFSNNRKIEAQKSILIDEGTVRDQALENFESCGYVFDTYYTNFEDILYVLSNSEIKFYKDGKLSHTWKYKIEGEKLVVRYKYKLGNSNDFSEEYNAIEIYRIQPKVDKDLIIGADYIHP